jgi:hypothetical protein
MIPVPTRTASGVDFGGCITWWAWRLKWASLEAMIIKRAIKPDTQLPRHLEAAKRRCVVSLAAMGCSVTGDPQLMEQQHITRVVSINTETPQQVSLRFVRVGEQTRACGNQLRQRFTELTNHNARRSHRAPSLSSLMPAACTIYPTMVSSPSCLHASKRCSPSTRTKRSPSCRTRVGFCSPI